jgi:hypothetical protein
MHADSAANAPHLDAPAVRKQQEINHQECSDCRLRNPGCKGKQAAQPVGSQFAARTTDATLNEMKIEKADVSEEYTR